MRSRPQYIYNGDRVEPLCKSARPMAVSFNRAPMGQNYPESPQISDRNDSVISICLSTKTQ